MKTKHSYHVLPVFGLSLLVSAVTQASTIENAVDTTGLTGFVDIAYGDHTINSGLASNVEVDNYRFSGVAGDSLRVILSTSTGGLDLQAVLRGPDGSIIQTVSCNGNAGSFGAATRCSAALDQTLSTTGDYFLNLSDLGANESGNYTMSLDLNPPVNNWTGIAYDEALDETLGHLGDTDFLAFNGAAGSGVQLTVASLSGGLDLNLDVWDPLGNLIENVACNGNSGSFGAATLCSVTPELNLTETGIYKIGLADTGWNETGNYRLGISCLYGACPSEAPSLVPLPPAVWLFGSGLLGLGAILRRKS